MCEEGLGMIGNELGFLWEEHQNQYMSSWVNLSNNNSENYSSGGGGTDQSAAHEEEEEAVMPGKTNMPPPTAASTDGGQNGNISAATAKGKGPAREGPSSNRKRSRGALCKNNNNNGKNKNNINNDNIINVSGDRVAKVGGAESDHEIHIWTERERRKKMRNMFSNLHALLPQLPSKADKSTIVDEAVNYIRTLQQTLQNLQKQKLDKLQSGATTTTTTTSTSTSPNSTTNLTEPSLIIMPNNQPITREAFLADQAGSCGDLLTNNNHNNNNNVPLNTADLSGVSQLAQPHEHIVGFQTWTSSNVVLNVAGDEAHISVCSPRKPGLFSSICYVLEKHKIAIVSAQLSSDGLRNMYMIHAHASTNGASDQFMEAFISAEEVFKQAVGEIMFWVSS